MKRIIKPCCAIVLLTYGLFATTTATGWQLETIAGTGSPENNGDSGPATSMNLGDPFGVEVGPDGALYITEVRNHRIRRLDFSSGELTTIAGCGRRGYSGDGGPAVGAELNEPYEVRFDAAGNMYFVEMRNHVVRRVDCQTKTITTVAGIGKPGFGGDGGPAVKALLNQPHSITLDGANALYIADIGNHRIRRVDLNTGVIESIAGNSDRSLPRDGQVARGSPVLGPRALFIEGNTLWIGLREGQSIWRMNLNEGLLAHVAGTGQAGSTGDGGLAALATFNGPKGIAIAANGDIFVADSENHAIRRIDARSGVIETIAGGGTNEHVIAGRGGKGLSQQLKSPHGVCIGPDGSVYVGDTSNHRVCRVRRSAQ